MRGRRCDEDDDHPLSSTSRGHTTRGSFPCRFARIFFVRSPRAHPGRPGWPELAGWMKAQIRAKSRNRGHDWTVFRCSDEKKRYRKPRRAREWRCSKHLRWRISHSSTCSAARLLEYISCIMYLTCIRSHTESVRSIPCRARLL
jgi:hypothetical protein